MAALNELARWVSQSGNNTLPSEVVARSALRHASTAAAVRGVGGDLPALAGHAIGSALADFGLLGVPMVGSVMGAWSVPDCAWDDAVAAVGFADEVIGRVEIFLALQHGPAVRRTWATALGAAIARARLLGLDAEHTAMAMAMALDHDPKLGDAPTRADLAAAHSAACAHGLACVDAASDGEQGDRFLLDRAEAPPFAPAMTVLPTALGALGTTWLSLGITLRITPAATWACAPVQAFEEVLRRHVKAASRAIRPEQIVSIEVRVDHLTWRRALDHGGDPRQDLAEAFARLAVIHEELGLDWPERGDHAEMIERVAATIEVVPDLGLTTKRLRYTAHQLGGLFAALPDPVRRQAFAGAIKSLVADAPMPKMRDIVQMLKRNPLEALADVTLVESDLSALAGERPHPSRPVELRMRTTRGGWWMERRDVVEGGPEYGLPDLRALVLRKVRLSGADVPSAEAVLDGNSTTLADAKRGLGL